MSYNKIAIIGNLGRDPELRYTPQGDAVCDFSVAVNDRRRDKTGEFQDVTTWFKVTFWRKQAENASKFLTKGRQVYVEGRLQIEEWTDRDGKNRYTLVIQGTEMQFLGEKPGEFSDNSHPPVNEEFSGTEPSETSFKTAPAGDDDIPF